MRPNSSRSASQDPNAPTLKGTKAWGVQDQQQQQQQQLNSSSLLNDHTFQQDSYQQTPQQPTSFVTQKSGTSRIYSIEELLKVWQEIQEKIQNGESVESYRSLGPIKTLVEQIERDRSFQGNLKKDDPQVAEITEKLNEITRWAKNETPSSSATANSTGFANLLNKDVPSSPFSAQKSTLLNDHHQPLHSPYGNNSVDVPLAQPALLQPYQIKWYYLDPAGNQQGPFDGVLMQNWYSGGYLTADLNLRREDEYNYYPLQQLLITVNNYQEPFLVPLPDLTPKSQSFPLQHSLSFDQQLPNFFNQGVSHQPQAQSQFQNVHQNWSTNSGHSSPWVSQTNLATEPVATQDFRIGGTQSPFMNTSFDNQSSSSLARASADNVPVQNEHDDILEHIHSKVLNDVLQEEVEPVAETAVEQEKSQQPFAPNDEQRERESKVPTATSTAAKAAVDNHLTKQSSRLVDPKPSLNEQRSPEVSKVLRTEAPSTQQAPKLAPWANKSVSKVPELTLEQIQRLEAEESAKQAKAKAEQDKLLAAQLLANTEKSIKESEAPKTILPSTSSWGTPSKSSSAPAKTLLDIQREEEAAAAKQAAVQAAALATSTTSSPLNVTPAQKAPSAKGSFASIATSSTPSGNAWTVVSSNRKPITAKPSAPKITSGPKPVTPDVLRNVSAATAAQVQPTSTFTKTVSPRQEFLSWCRTSMKLNKGVNKDEVLQIMLMLPVGSESSEIIADTIYSNSSTMDGRRFAQEFMKRRRTIEDQSHDGLSWNEALRISAENDDEGWDFQVVGKKKKGRN